MRLPLANRHVANYSAHRETCVRLRRQPRAKQINVAQSEAVQCSEPTPCLKNALEAEASAVKIITSRTVARTLVPKKEVKPAKQQKYTEDGTCQC